MAYPLPLFMNFFAPGNRQLSKLLQDPQRESDSVSPGQFRFPLETNTAVRAPINKRMDERTST